MRTLSFDAAGRIVGYTHTVATNWNQVFGYDGLDRLISANLTGGNTYGYAYDATGNRTQTTINGTAYASTVSTSSNWYTNVATAAGGATAQGYDAAGHLTSDANGNYTYSGRGRLASELRSGNTFSYLYNAFEQRVYKAGPSSVITTGAAYYVYDESGRVVGEYDASGKAVYETVYLGDMPVAALTAPTIGQTTVSYVYADHLNTARVIVRPSDQAIIWSWGSNEPFGQSQVNSNPNGLGTFTYNPRFPGQVADAESGWFYNGYRDYNPALGRYTGSDPIGLGGGINTYGYVFGAPVRYFDRTGLAVEEEAVEEDGEAPPTLENVLSAAKLAQIAMEIRRVDPNYNGPSTISRGAPRYTQRDVDAEQNYLDRLLRSRNEGRCSISWDQYRQNVSRQKQARHLQGNLYGGGGYLDSMDDADEIYDAFQSGNAQYLGRSTGGHVIINYNGVTGTNVNPGAGISGQPTNTFLIKGTSSPSVVPTTPRP